MKRSIKAYDLAVACLADRAFLLALEGGLPLGFKTARYVLVGETGEFTTVVGPVGAAMLRPFLT